MIRVALFVDISDLYYGIKKRYEGRKLDYQKLLSSMQSYGTILRAFAYGAQSKEEAISFITCLRKIGYDMKYKDPHVEVGDPTPAKRARWEVGITLDVVRMISRVDVVVLCSGSPAFVPLALWARDRGVRVIVTACSISRELREVADQCVEVEESMLEEVRGNAA